MNISMDQTAACTALPQKTTHTHTHTRMYIITYIHTSTLTYMPAPRAPVAEGTPDLITARAHAQKTSRGAVDKRRTARKDNNRNKEKVGFDKGEVLVEKTAANQ